MKLAKYYSLQMVYNMHHDPEEGGSEVAIVLRSLNENYAMSNQPKEWFSQVNAAYKVIGIDSMAGSDFNIAMAIKESLFLDHKITLKRAIYERVQRYGGPEEGGWYYHNLLPSNLDLVHTKNPEGFMNKLDEYGEGFLEFDELVDGEFTNDIKEFYH